MNKNINRDTVLDWLKLLRWQVLDGHIEAIDVPKLMTLTIQWFDYYQGERDIVEMKDLYKELIHEELTEVSVAWYDKDVIEILDWYVDYLWVSLWYIWFNTLKNNENIIEPDAAILEEVTEEFNKVLDTIIVPWDLFLTAWLEIAYSNWTKSLELRDETDPEWKIWKVIKWKDYVKPDLENVFTKINKIRNANNS